MFIWFQIVDNGIEPRFRLLTDAVRNLRDSVEETLDESGGLFEDDGQVELHQECCSSTDLQENLNFPDVSKSKETFG